MFLFIEMQHWMIELQLKCAVAFFYIAKYFINCNVVTKTTTVDISLQLALARNFICITLAANFPS